MEKLFGGAYKGKTVMVTGHTGFKGSWLVFWLQKMGAKVVGFSLDDPSDPCHFRLLNLKMDSLTGDIRDVAQLEAVITRHKPEVIVHMAAQALVRKSYAQPLETYQTNVMGTLNLLDACRKAGGVKVVLCVTSDKVYDNQEWTWGYRETDKLGGYDPYSSSKACAEISVSSFRNSFFNLKDHGHKHSTLVASLRAGNVVGGGDWAVDRLIPDIVRACSRKETVIIRSPDATRPWQHVLECLSGYLVVGQKLLEGKKEAAREWNFGPTDTATMSVERVVQHVKHFWPEFNYEIQRSDANPHEAYALTLDSSLARVKLGWRQVWAGTHQTFQKTIGWYQKYYGQGILVSEEDLKAFVKDAQDGKLPWAT